MCVDILWYRCSVSTVHWTVEDGLEGEGRCVFWWWGPCFVWWIDLQHKSVRLCWQYVNNILGAKDVGVIITNPTNNVILRDWRILCTARHFHSPNLKDIHWWKFCWSIIMRPAKFKVIGACLEYANTTLWGYVHLGHLRKKFGEPLRSMRGCYQRWIVVLSIVVRYFQGLCWLVLLLPLAIQCLEAHSPVGVPNHPETWAQQKWNGYCGRENNMHLCMEEHVYMS